MSRPLSRGSCRTYQSAFPDVSDISPSANWPSGHLGIRSFLFALLRILTVRGLLVPENNRAFPHTVSRNNPGNRDRIWQLCIVVVVSYTRNKIPFQKSRVCQQTTFLHFPPFPSGVLPTADKRTQKLPHNITRYVFLESYFRFTIWTFIPYVTSLCRWIVHRVDILLTALICKVLTIAITWIKGYVIMYLVYISIYHTLWKCLNIRIAVRRIG